MPRLAAATCRRLIAAARHGVLATTGETHPHQVPIVYAIDGDTLVTAVDHKPKSTTDLTRAANLARNPRCSVLVEHYDDEDWDRLWWVRIDGNGAIDGSPTAVAAAGRLLARQFPQYLQQPPQGPVVTIAIERLVGWAAVAP